MVPSPIYAIRIAKDNLLDRLVIIQPADMSEQIQLFYCFTVFMFAGCYFFLPNIYAIMLKLVYRYVILEMLAEPQREQSLLVAEIVP